MFEGALKNGWREKLEGKGILHKGIRKQDEVLHENDGKPIR